VPCIDSPVIPFIRDYFVVNAAILIDVLNSKLKDTVLWDHPNISLRTAPPEWFNVSDPFYGDAIELILDNAVKTDIKDVRANASAFAGILRILDDAEHCWPSKRVMKNQQFLFCSYTRDNADMITMTQGVGALLLLILTMLGIPAINEFKYVESAMKKGPQAKRAVNPSAPDS
jgi:hypothetical protein